MNHKIEKALFSIQGSIRQTLAKNLLTIALEPNLEIRLRNVVNASLIDGYHSVIDDVIRTIDENSHSITSVPHVFFDVLYELAQTNRRDLVAFTLVRNERVFLPIWHRYYSSVVGDSNVFILDDSSTDGSVVDLKARFPSINVINVSQKRSCNYEFNTELIKTFQRLLLKHSDVCIYTDVDEFLIPARGTLRDLCLSTGECIRATGYGVVHQVDHEPNAIKSDPLSSRSKMWRTLQYDKTLVSRVPLNWSKGQHSFYLENGEKSQEPASSDLILLHLRDFDFETYCSRLDDRLRTNPVVAPYGATNRQQVETWFRTLTMPWIENYRSEYVGEPLNVPEYWRALLRDDKFYDAAISVSTQHANRQDMKCHLQA